VIAAPIAERCVPASWRDPAAARGAARQLASLPRPGFFAALHESAAGRCADNRRYHPEQTPQLTEQRWLRRGNGGATPRRFDARVGCRRGGAHLCPRLCARAVAPAFARSRPLRRRVCARARRRRSRHRRALGITAISAAASVSGPVPLQLRSRSWAIWGRHCPKRGTLRAHAAAA
jgi:hypothetical protein